jgi:iron complex transport system substrate-binding protein
VGVSSFDRYPAEATTRPRVGALIDPDLERILALRPDLVVAYASQDDLRAQLARASIAVFAYRHATLADVMATLRTLGAAVGRTDEATTLAARIDEDIAEVRARVASARRPRVLLVFGREPGTLRNIHASGGYGFLHDMLAAAGGENIFAAVRRESVQATSELILARQPDVIVELRSPGLNPPGAREPDAAWQTLASVPAVRTRRIVVLIGDEYVVPGPRVAGAIQQLARTLHPEAFAR